MAERIVDYYEDVRITSTAPLCLNVSATPSVYSFRPRDGRRWLSSRWRWVLAPTPRCSAPPTACSSKPFRFETLNHSSVFAGTGETRCRTTRATTVSPARRPRAEHPHYRVVCDVPGIRREQPDDAGPDRCAPFGRVNLVVDGHAEIATSFISTGNYYRLLGVTATLGRTIVPDDDKPGVPPVALISHRYWRSRFGSDSSVIGKNVQMNNVPVTIVGVLSPDYIGIQQTVAEPPDISVALAMEPQLQIGNAASRLSLPTTWWLQVMGRLKPGVTPEQVQANLATVFQHTARAGMDAYLAGLTPEVRARSTNQNRTAVPTFMADSGKRGIYDVNTNDLRAVTILTVVVALVLLIVCANVANLLLSRATARQKRDFRPSVAGRDARTPGSPVADREPAAGGARRRARHRWLATGSAACYRRRGPDDAVRLAGRCVPRRRHRLTGILFGIAAGAARNAHQRQRAH